ncbi:uncharacterized protein LOC110178582 [Drosophila serrata]|uniref:uncharacterized protein LOC110178582 n=1 Tax=Drosophila serrata TaxID=7274 RepID=UPI000A1CF5A8|nr:uncharacterized protein LOC110178582 [Drosophila serrata]
MRVSVTFLFLGFCLCSALAEDELVELLKDNTNGIGRANELLTRIATVYEETKANLAAQKEALNIVTLVQELLARLEVVLVEKTDLMVATLFNISKQGEEYAKRSESELLELARAQQVTAQLLRVLESKMDAYQTHVLQSARNIDKNINGLARLITRTVLPQLNGLKCSVDSLETSQINVEVELKRLAGIKEISINSNHKLDVLERQLKDVNRTQEVRLAELTHAVKHLQPLNSWKVEGALRELIISQKRIELDLEECSHHSQSYESSYQTPHPKPHPHPRPEPKRVDLVQVWNVKGPQKQGEYPESSRVSAYAQSPEPKKYHSQSSHSSSTWRDSLPWETAPQYHPAPAPYEQPWKPAPAHSSHPTTKPKPCPKEEHGYKSHSHPESSPKQPIFKPQPVQPDDSYRIWYEDDTLPQGY